MGTHGNIARALGAMALAQAAIRAAALCMAAVAAGAAAAPYAHPMKLTGEVENTTKVSGYRGSTFTLTLNDGSHAMYGISSAERSDNPCWLWIGSESINDSTVQTGDIKDLCGNKATSSTMKAEYRDNMDFGKRVFVTGLNVCTNNKETRVKGFQLRGKQVLDDGRLQDLQYPGSYVVVGLSGGGDWSGQRERWVNDSKAPGRLSKQLPGMAPMGGVPPC